MRRLITNAPIQNRAYDIDRQFGSTLTIFAADWLAEQSGEPADRVDLWNSNLASEERTNTSVDEHRRQMTGRLAAKYDGLLLGARVNNRYMTDIDTDFCEWGKGMVCDALESGVVLSESRPVHACRTCGATLALASAPLSNGCSSCAKSGDKSQTEIVTRPTLLITTTAAQQFEAFRMAGIRQGHKGGYLKDREYAVNKQRLTGISLDELGFTGEVLDPKVAIGLLALYAASEYAADEIQMTVGQSSAHHNIGHLLGFLGDNYRISTAELVIKPIARAPVGYLNHLRDSGVVSDSRVREFIRTGLPPQLLGRRRPIAPREAETMIFSRRSWRNNID